MFFKNRAVQVSLVKKSDDHASDTVEVKTVEPEQIAEIAKDFVVKTAIVVGCVLVVSFVLSAACEIAVTAAKANIEE